MRALALFLVAGCDLVYSLDRPPVVPNTVEVRYRNIALASASDTDTLVDVAYPTLAVTVTLDDGTSVVASPVVEGSFTFERVGDAPYRIRFDVPGEIPSEYLTNVASLDVGIKRTRRPDAQAPAPGTQLHIDMPGAPTAEGFASVVQTTGVWAQASPDTAAQNASFDVDWTSTGFLGGPGLLDASKGDHLYCTSSSSGEFVSIDKVGEVAAPTMQDGATSSVTCNLAAVVRDRCVRLDVKHSDENTRLKSVANTFPASQSLTVVMAAPNPVHSASGLWLANRYGNDEGDAGVRDYAGDLMYAQPFPGHEVLVQTRTLRARSMFLDGVSKGLTLALGTFRFFRVETDACDRTIDTSPRIAIPSSPTIAGVGLVSDDTPIELDRAQRIPITWSLGPGGTVDRFVVRLFEIVIVNNAPALSGAYQWITNGTERRIDIDPAILVPGKRYIIVVESNLGIPGAAEGNMVDIKYPFAIASFPSPMFRIEN